MFVNIEQFSNLALNMIGALGYVGVFIGTVFLPSEVILPLAGVAVFHGKMNLVGVTLVAAASDVLGSFVVYFIAYKGGRPLLEKYGRYVFIDHQSLDEADKWFDKYGPEAVLICKFLPLMGRFISLPAGIAGMNLKKFILYTFVGSLPFAFVLVYSGYKLGPHIHILTGYIHTGTILVLIGVVAVLLYIIYKHKHKLNW